MKIIDARCGARSSPTFPHRSSYIMEQIIRATLRDVDALHVRCEQRNNLADDEFPMGASIVCELSANFGAIEHPRDITVVLLNEANAPVRNVPFVKKGTRNNR